MATVSPSRTSNFMSALPSRLTSSPACLNVSSRSRLYSATLSPRAARSVAPPPFGVGTPTPNRPPPPPPAPHLPRRLNPRLPRQKQQPPPLAHNTMRKAAGLGEGSRVHDGLHYPNGSHAVTCFGRI